jgi:hypothetical protein
MCAEQHTWRTAVAKKHIVTPTESFEHEFTIGALVVGGKEISPAQTRKTPYIAGQRIEFNSKADAEKFVKVHNGKMKYVGKE